MRLDKYTKMMNITVFTLSAVLFLTAVLLFTTLFRYDQKTQTGGELYSVYIDGEYSEEGGPWKKLTRETTFKNLELRDITVRGHFNRSIPKNMNLFLNLDHMRVCLRINGNEIFKAEPTDDENLTKALGKQWVTINSPGITTKDEVEINFGNLYWNAYMIQFDELLWRMNAGDSREMFFEAIKYDSWPLAVGAVFLFLTLFFLIVSICCSALRLHGALRFLWLGLSALFSALWFITLTPVPTLIFPLPIFFNVVYAFSMQMMFFFLLMFITSWLSGWRKTLMLVCEDVMLLTLLAGLANQMLRIQDLYSAINWLSIVDLVIVLIVIGCLIYEAHRLKKEAASGVLKSIAVLAVCGVVELINGYVQFMVASILLGIGLGIFIIMEGVYLLRRIKQSLENEKRALELENELHQNRIAIMTSQIQPHFLYNALTGIKRLCDTDPHRASEALGHFSYFLRGNLDSLVTTELVPFDKELTHVRDYLYLEKMRFEEDLHIAWDIRFTEFMLPALTVQPIAENGIRYGITKKEGVGTLTIRSERQEDTAVVTVIDDGVGFDVAKEKDDGRTHTGIQNVRSRLEAQCNGRLEIESEKGVGTTVTITLPLHTDAK